MSRIESNKNVVTSFFAALNDRRMDLVAGYLASDVVDHNKIIFGEPDEPGAALEGFRQQLDAFGTGRLDPEELIAEDNRVAVRVLASGVHTGYHPRMPDPTHRPFEAEQIWIFTVREGRIGEIRGVSDRLGMFLQLGWDWPTG
jgi:ketosteroid isomerase-like protein